MNFFTTVLLSVFFFCLSVRADSGITVGSYPRSQFTPTYDDIREIAENCEPKGRFFPELAGKINICYFGAIMDNTAVICTYGANQFTCKVHPGTSGDSASSHSAAVTEDTGASSRFMPQTMSNMVLTSFAAASGALLLA